MKLFKSSGGRTDDSRRVISRTVIVYKDCDVGLGAAQFSSMYSIVVFNTSPRGQLHSLQWSVALHPRYIHTVKGGYCKGLNPRLAKPTPLNGEGAGESNHSKMPFL